MGKKKRIRLLEVQVEDRDRWVASLRADVRRLGFVAEKQANMLRLLSQRVAEIREGAGYVDDPMPTPPGPAADPKRSTCPDCGSTSLDYMPTPFESQSCRACGCAWTLNDERCRPGQTTITHDG